MKIHKWIANRLKRGPERTSENGKGKWRSINGRHDDEPYLIRYFLFDSRWFDIYIHEIKRSDDAPDFHDHPWPFFHMIMEGSYIEEAPGENLGEKFRNRRKRGYFAFRRAEYAHRLVLDQGDAWTLVISGKRCRKWGFVSALTGCWVHWKSYIEGERC